MILSPEVNHPNSRGYFQQRICYIEIKQKVIFLFVTEIHPRKQQEAIHPRHSGQGGTGFRAGDPPPVDTLTTPTQSHDRP